VGQRKGPSGANAPPVHGIKKCLGRGQENLRAMTTETFDISTDSSGKRYIHQKKDELDKNHRDTSTGAVTQGKMYELPGIYLYPCIYIIAYA
jgi:hypothetical protein